MKKLMRIDEDYYVDVPPDPSGEELEEVLATLRELIRGPADEGEDDEFLTGLEDCYYGLLVGPCDREAAETEAECPLVDEIGVGNEDAFDCAYEEWAQYLRGDVLRAAEEKCHKPSPPPPSDADIAERVQQATASGLEDGTRIEPHGDGWVVVDRFQSYLTDPEDASWIVDPDDEDVPLAVFPTAEAAYRAWARSGEVAKARARRREEALRRLRNG